MDHSERSTSGKDLRANVRNTSDMAVVRDFLYWLTDNERLPEAEKLIRLLDERSRLRLSVKALRDSGRNGEGVDGVESILRGVSEETDKLLDCFVGDGLRARLGLHLDQDTPYFEALLNMRSNAYAPLPAGIAVCRKCGYVFEPKRKGHAEACEFCDGHPNSEPLTSTWKTADGSYGFHGLLTGTYYSKTCKTCHGPFLSKRSDADFCPGGACSKRYKRRVAKGLPGADDVGVWSAYLDELFGDRSDLRHEYELGMKSSVESYVRRLDDRIKAAIVANGVPSVSRDDLLAERHG